MTARSPAPRRASIAVLFVGLSILGAVGARADECPKDKVLKDHADIGWKDDAGIRRHLMGIIDLTGWRNTGDLRLRMRRLTIPPGGIIPTHDHSDRPSLVYFVKGTTIEHNSKCAVPIEHHEGE